MPASPTNCAMPDDATASGGDLWLGGQLRLAQPPRGAHRAGTDAALLVALLHPEPGATVYDVGAASGAVGLAVALREPSVRVVLVEREAHLAALARRNIAANGLGDRVIVIEADVLAGPVERRESGLIGQVADLVLTNPPFFEAGRHRPSPNADKATAHSFAAGSLDLWLKTCLDLLKAYGTLGLIHRADALPDCLDALRRRFGAITVRAVHPRADRPAIRVLVTAVKGSRAPFAMRPPLVLQTPDGAPTPEADAHHRGMPWPA